MAELPNGARIYVAGHRGLVGSAISRTLRAKGHGSILERARSELDLTDAAAVDRFFADEKPDYVFLAAAKVGGINANSTYPADFIRENLAIEVNVIHSAWRQEVSKTAVSWIVLHLSETGSATDIRRGVAGRSAGADQRGLRNRQDRRPQDVRGLQAATWFQRDQFDAHELVRTGR